MFKFKDDIASYYPCKFGNKLRYPDSPSRVSCLFWDGMTLGEYTARRYFYGWLHNVDDIGTETMSGMLFNPSNLDGVGSGESAYDQMTYTHWREFEDYLERGFDSLIDEVCGVDCC